jgi:hypothetical protein
MKQAMPGHSGLHTRTPLLVMAASILFVALVLAVLVYFRRP